MPIDKLILLAPSIEKKFVELARRSGTRKGGYERFLDLQKSEFELPVRLYCMGFRDGTNKIELVDPATLGLSRTKEIVKLICGRWYRPTICRIDCAVDIIGIPAREVAACCRVSKVQTTGFFHSRGRVSIYPHLSKPRALLIYEKLKDLRAKHHPFADAFSDDECLTRFEVQFRGKGVPFRDFRDISRYAHIDLLKNVTFLKLRRLRPDLKPQQILAAERMRDLVHEVGLQNASKRFSAPWWAYTSTRLFEPASQENIPDIRFLMQKSVLDWLEDRIRFPRCAKRVGSSTPHKKQAATRVA